MIVPSTGSIGMNEIKEPSWPLLDELGIPEQMLLCGAIVFWLVSFHE